MISSIFIVVVVIFFCWLSVFSNKSYNIHFLSPCPRHRTLTYPCHPFNFPIRLSIFQQPQCQLNLLLCELLGSAVLKVGILTSCHFAGLGALCNHTPFVFRKGKHNCEDEIAGEGVFYKAHVQDVYFNASVE